MNLPRKTENYGSFTIVLKSKIKYLGANIIKTPTMKTLRY